MNLYIIHEISRATAYGIGTYIRELAIALKNSEINVCVIHLHANKQMIEMDETIRHIYIPSPAIHDTSRNRNELNELYYRDVARHLQLQIDNKEKLIFHINSLINNMLALLLRDAFDCRIVITVHSFVWVFKIFDNLPRLRKILNEDSSDNFGNNIKKTFEEEKSFFAIADQIVCLSKYMRDVLCQEYGIETEKVTVVPGGLSNDDNYSTVDIEQLREKWKIPDFEKIILFVGRMDDNKGLDYLLKAFREVLSLYPQSRLVIAGEGAFSFYTKVSQDICSRITYTGFLDKPQLYEWYQMADIGIIPSLFESFGYVALEMMMHGLPVVATATSGMNEVIDESCGLKMPLTVLPNSVEIDTTLLAHKIACLLQNPAVAKRFRNNVRQRYREKYALPVFGSNMIEIYKSLFP